MANSNGWGDGAANNAISWGQGANNAIAWGDSHAKSWAGATDIVGLTTDPDAQAFITAAAITDPTQQAAIDNLVKGLKSDNIWTKMKAIYPFVGGTASTHKWNLKDPRDLDAAFRLVFNGGWTHSSNGATPNGTNGFANTYLNPATVINNVNDGHLSYYSRTNSTNISAIEIGCADLSTSFDMVIKFGASNLAGACINMFDSNVFTNAATSLGFYHANQNNIPNVRKMFLNGSSIATQTVAQNATPSVNIYIGARNAGAQFNTNRQCAFSSIGNGLTDTEAANLYTRVQAYQTALSRNV